MNEEIINFFKSFKPVFEFAIDKLTGSERRIYLAQIAKTLGYRGQKIVCENFNIDSKTLLKGIEGLECGVPIIDAFDKRGRNSIEIYLPNLLNDIKDIVDSASQTYPRFEDNRLYTRLTPLTIKEQLQKKGYKLEELPTNQTIYNKVNALGYSFSTIQKTKPVKKIAETDAIFFENKTSQ